MARLPLLAAPYEALSAKFELIDLLGQGSFGDVWKARNLETEQIVALKIPRDQELGEEALRHEPDLMRAFNHPNIVRVYGCHTIGAHFVIEMEYIEGYDLAKMLDGVNRSNPLSYQRILEWATQILEGLQAIHAAQVVHNDIKPHNVLIDLTGNAKLVDFGTSRRLEDVWVWTRRQGTEAYWAPEVAFESKRSTVSDLYSVGVMLYEMVTGELPYRSPYELASGRTIKRPREINPNIPPRLEIAILQAMARDPQARYPDATTMLADIKLLQQELATGQIPLPPDRTHVTQIPFRLDSSSPLYYIEKAKRLLAEENLAEALQAAEIAVDRSDGHADHLRMLGGIYMRMGYFSSAVTTYERVLTAYQTTYPATTTQLREVLERLGGLYIKVQRYRQAVKVYEQLVTVADNQPLARFRLAVAYGLEADYRKAIRLLEEVRKERPDAVVVYSKLGWAYMLQGKFREALSYYNQALVFDGADVFSLFQLGKYYWIQGDRSRARSYLERARQHDSTGKYWTEIDQILGMKATTL